jgi:hypothetical protein
VTDSQRRKLLPIPRMWLTSRNGEQSRADRPDLDSRRRWVRAEAEAGLQAGTTQLAALNALAQRAAQRVGSCPGCGQQITGHDLLATGRCGTCGRYGCAAAGRVTWT